MKNFVILLLVAIIIPSVGYPVEEKKTHLMPMAGGGYYNREGNVHSDYVLGLTLGYQATDWISVEGQLRYMPVNNDDYYFILFGGRYRFVRADFFMNPSVDIHGGALVPQGDKTDIDGVLGAGAMLLYPGKWGVQFGPQVAGNLVFEGPHISTWVNYMFVIKYDFE